MPARARPVLGGGLAVVARAEQHHGVAGRLRRVRAQVEHELVHAHPTGDAEPTAPDLHRPAPGAVGRPGGRAAARRRRSRSGRARARSRASWCRRARRRRPARRGPRLAEGQVRLQPHRRAQPEVGRSPEVRHRGQPVDRQPGPHQVVVHRGVGERRRGVGQVADLESAPRDSATRNRLGEHLAPGACTVGWPGSSANARWDQTPTTRHRPSASAASAASSTASARPASARCGPARCPPSGARRAVRPVLRAASTISASVHGAPTDRSTSARSASAKPGAGRVQPGEQRSGRPPPTAARAPRPAARRRASSAPPASAARAAGTSPWP